MSQKSKTPALCEQISVIDFSECKEYSNVHEEIIPPVAPATETIRIRRCGLEKISLIPESLQTDEFPFMVD